jgi:transporter family protein
VAFGALIFAWFWSPWKALAAMPIGSFILLALGGFLASFVGQWAFYHALKVGDISQVTPVSGAYPLVAAILAWMIFREPITITRVVGVLLIVTGALLLKR